MTHTYSPLELWRPDIPNQGVGRAALLLKAPAGILTCSSSYWWLLATLDCGHILPTSLLVTSPSSLYPLLLL